MIKNPIINKGKHMEMEIAQHIQDMLGILINVAVLYLSNQHGLITINITINKF